MQTKLNPNVVTPRSCKIPVGGDPGFSRAIAVEDALRLMTEAGVEMSDEELLAAHNEEQPSLNQLRRFLCWGCHLDCPFTVNNEERQALNRKLTVTFRSLTEGNSEERTERGKLYLLKLLPKPVRQKLTEHGIEVNPINWSSRRHPHVCIVFRKGETVTHQIMASSETISVNGEYSSFTEFALECEVNKVVRALMAA